MKRYFKSLFGVTSKEVRGVRLLLIIFLLSLAYPTIYRVLAPKVTYSSDEDSKILDSLVDHINRSKQEVKVEFEKFNFNPNKSSKEELTSLGFDERTANQILNYRTSGGVFRVKKDLYKIYSIDSSLVTSLYSYISLPEVVSKSKRSKKIVEELKNEYNAEVSIPEKNILPKFDLNLADTATLQTISGIGSVLSNRIVTFRDNLGGFWTTNQLYEVYYLDSIVIEKILRVAYLKDDFDLKKLDINHLSEDELANHPYVTRKQARLIVAYRNQHGNFIQESDLARVYLIDDSDINRLRPYLSFD